MNEQETQYQKTQTPNDKKDFKKPDGDNKKVGSQDDASIKTGGACGVNNKSN